MKPQKIVLITFWYGPFPWYFQYFVHSCGFNLSISFIIVTDNDKPYYDIPNNVTFVCRTIEEIKTIASQKMGFQVSIDYAYKLCDFKPTYGLLFPELIAGYDFWGYSDIDIILGNIRGFITDEMLQEYDFISVRHDYTTGCFALYRNNEIMNLFFKRSKDYKLVFSSSQHFCFDECNFAWDALDEGKSILDINTEIESMTELIKKAQVSNEINPHFDFLLVEGLPGKVMFDNGKIIYKNQFEGIMYHLVRFKRIYNPSKISKTIPGKYYISPTRIYHNRKSK